MRKALLLILFLPGIQKKAFSQESQEDRFDFKNTIRINVTNPLIFGMKSIMFGYERILNKKSSFSINVGQASFPKFNLFDSDSLVYKDVVSEKGFHISADYRFYLSKINKYEAPRGVYIGPYVSYNYFERKNAWSLTSTGGGQQLVESTTTLTVANIGFQMGYQFVFWDRISLDMILFGPGVASYKLEATLADNLSEEDRQKLFQYLNDALADKIPGFDLVIDEGEFGKTGTTNTTSAGFRYMVMVGIRF
jgi:hypothetical protein